MNSQRQKREMNQWKKHQKWKGGKEGRKADHRNLGSGKVRRAEGRKKGNLGGGRKEAGKAKKE